MTDPETVTTSGPAAAADRQPAVATRGLVLGSARWVEDLLPLLDPLAGGWHHATTGGVPDLEGVAVLIDTTAAAPEDEPPALTTGVADAILAAATPPARVILLVGDEWLGTSGSLGAAARSGAAMAVCRGLALRLIAAGTTVNAIAVPPGFPTADVPGTAPIRHPVGLAELVHALTFFTALDNDYVTGQVLSLSGGDTTWSNLSA